MRASDRDLILAYMTLPHLAPPEFVSVAAESGYQGISLRMIPANPPVEKPFPLLDGSPMLKETVTRLKNTGLYVNDVEVFRLKSKFDATELKPVMDAAALLEARNFLVLADDDDEARVADNLARIAELTASYNIRTCLEFMIYVGVKTAEQARRVLAASGCEGIGIVVDPLHLERSGGAPDVIATFAPDQISSLQFCDAGARPDVGDLEAVIAEARGGRMIPGTGTLPLKELLAVTPPAAPIAVEVPIRSMLDSTPETEIAAVMREATLQIISEYEASRPAG